MSTKTERSAKIDVLTKALESASGIYLTDINKISVAQISQLRVELRKKNSKYLVVKNSLAKIALERCGKKELVEYVHGPIGVAITSGDSTDPIKVIRDFKKENKDILEVKAAFVDGTVFGSVNALRLADIPSRIELLSQLLSVLQAPITNFAGSLYAIISTFAATLEAVKDQKEKEGISA